MKYLLDTHVLLWCLENNPSLTGKHQSLLKNPDNQIFSSIVSCWEIAIKKSLKKLELTVSLEELFQKVGASGISSLPLEMKHLVAVENLPFHHRDPFDRLLISQAMTENMVIMTGDGIFSKYDILIEKI